MGSSCCKSVENESFKELSYTITTEKNKISNNANNETKSKNINTYDSSYAFTEEENIITPRNEIKKPNYQYTLTDKLEEIAEESKDASDLELTRKKMIDSFYTDTLRKAEQRVGKFDRDKYHKYCIDSKLIERQIKIVDYLYYEDLFLVSDNVIYYGYRTENGARQGYGVLLKRGGIKWEGYWDNNKLGPYGRFINKNGNVYEGQFENGKLNGLGSEYNEEFEYEGSFKDGHKHGNGVLVSKAEIYEGQFIEDKKHGNGKIIMSKEDIEYVGEFVDNKMEGLGKITWKTTGDVYEGYFHVNQPHGKGKYIWKNGDSYEGDFSYGLKEGKGIMRWGNGEVYDGTFKNNIRCSTWEEY